MYRTDCRSSEPISLSRTPSQPRNCCGARSRGPDQPLRASGPLTSAKPASCRRNNNGATGPFENVSSKSPLFEERMITSPMSVVAGARYKSCPLRTCQLPAGSVNWCCEVVAQFVRSTIASAMTAARKIDIALRESRRPVRADSATFPFSAQARVAVRARRTVACSQKNKTTTSAT